MCNVRNCDVFFSSCSCISPRAGTRQKNVTTADISPLSGQFGLVCTSDSFGNIFNGISGKSSFGFLCVTVHPRKLYFILVSEIRLFYFSFR